MVLYSVSVLFYSCSSLVCIVTAFGMGYRIPVMSTSSATGVWTLGSKGWANELVKPRAKKASHKSDAIAALEHQTSPTILL